MNFAIGSCAAAILAVANLGVNARASEGTADSQVTAPGPEGDLAGTLINTGEGNPVVLILPGSGPTDRDGNNPMGVTASSYRLLAQSLAQQAISSLRIDKRGMFGSKAAVADPNAVTIADYTVDARAWVSMARKQTGEDCVWVLGHSEGGLTALEIASRPDEVCGVILLASVGRPLGDTLREQLQSNPANASILEQAFAAINALEAGERVDAGTLHPGLRGLFAPSVQGFLMDLLARDPAIMASKVTSPMLVISGGKDIQTPEADANALLTGQPDATLVIIPDMNHVLKTVEGDTLAANIATYGDSSLPLHPDLAEAIASFIKTPRD